MNNPEPVAQSFLNAYYQAFVSNRTGISAFYVNLKKKNINNIYLFYTA